MQHPFFKTLATFILSVCFIFSAQAETYTLEPTHSYILWHVNHFGFSNLSGKWMAQGTLNLDEANPQNSVVNVTINMADLVTGIPKLDEHLKSPDFFDVKKFPTATFVSNKIDVINKNTAKVHGMLTVHGVAKPVTLNMTLNKIAPNPMTHKKSVGLTGTTLLKRSDFDVSAHVPNVGDAVEIEIEVEAYKAE